MTPCVLAADLFTCVCACEHVCVERARERARERNRNMETRRIQHTTPCSQRPDSEHLTNGHAPLVDRAAGRTLDPAPQVLWNPARARVPCPPLASPVKMRAPGQWLLARGRARSALKAVVAAAAAEISRVAARATRRPIGSRGLKGRRPSVRARDAEKACCSQHGQARASFEARIHRKSQVSAP